MDGLFQTRDCNGVNEFWPDSHWILVDLRAHFLKFITSDSVLNYDICSKQQLMFHGNLLILRVVCDTTAPSFSPSPPLIRSQGKRPSNVARMLPSYLFP